MLRRRKKLRYVLTAKVTDSAGHSARASKRITVLPRRRLRLKPRPRSPTPLDRAERLVEQKVERLYRRAGGEGADAICQTLTSSLYDCEYNSVNVFQGLFCSGEGSVRFYRSGGARVRVTRPLTASGAPCV